MCGIFGYVGTDKCAIKMSLEGLKRLEYRGYDSAGMGGIHNGKVEFRKEVGKISSLQTTLDQDSLSWNMTIAQTRWATHGKVNRENAHPHCDSKQSLALVHNGIIENYDALKAPLIAKGVKFLSDTDTEVIAHLISDNYQGNILETIQQVVQMLKGSYAIVLIHEDYPDQIFAVAHESPLVIGIGDQEAFISSDPHAFAFYTREVIYLSHSEIAIVKADSQQIFNASRDPVSKNSRLLDLDENDISKGKGDFDHFTLKEIFEQPQSIRNALLGRFSPEYGTAIFEEMSLSASQLLTTERILILGCGTSWHAGLLAAYMIEDLARIPVQVEIASEFRYKNSIITANTCVIAISQSGETADVVSAVRELKARGVQVLALCNVRESTLSREADSCILLKAGPEIGVLSTKAFTSQVIVLALYTLLMARMRNMDKSKGQEFIQSLTELPDQVQSVLDRSDEIKALAKKYARYEHFFYVGRNYMYPVALEAALKLKESSYINANAYPGGEIKHGPIALINESCPTVALCANQRTLDKMISNLMELKARGGPIFAIVAEDSGLPQCVTDDVFVVPKCCDSLAVIPTIVALQLFVYYVALELGRDIDHPRNLAKSVTVE